MTFHHLLDALGEGRVCGLCTLEERAMKRYFDSILYESVTDPGVRADLRRAHGYCAAHALYLLSLRSAFDTAVLYQDEVEDLLALVESLAGKPSAGSKRTKPVKSTTGKATSRKPSRDEIPAEWLRHSKCPACRIQRETRSRYIQALVEGLGDRRMRKAVESGSGLCLPHLHLFLADCRRPEERNFVLDCEKRSLRGLKGELAELCRKFDYRFSRDAIGDERDSWRRAILFVNGSPLSFPDGLGGLPGS